MLRQSKREGERQREKEEADRERERERPIFNQQNQKKHPLEFFSRHCWQVFGTQKCNKSLKVFLKC